MNLQGIDHVEFYVGDASEEAGRLCTAYGFDVLGRAAGPGHESVLLGQGGIRLVLTTGLTGEHPATEYVLRHGDGLATIAIGTATPDETLAEAVHQGAVPLTLAAPGERTRIAAFGDVAHTFVAPGEVEARFGAAPTGGPALLAAIDHVAVCVPAGDLGPTVRFYEKALGFGEIFEEYIEVGDQAMNSKVVQSPSGEVTVTILEPDPGRHPGQIDGFIEAHGGAGVQHLAFRTDDIATAVRTFAERGVGFLTTPGSYYDELERRLGRVGVPLDTLRELNVLVDRDNEGELFQIFAHSTHPRRTFFVEIIERLGALTFGSANIKALYQAVERERARTGPGAGVPL
ncbi:MAG TPA: 4-hydroxyphenylpyruvate dioxygenase [Pseudonocardiaceae bacterium]